MPTPPTLLLLTGPPGTGKSSFADRAADHLGAPVLGWDWAMAALTEFDSIQSALRDLSHVEHRRVGWSILWNLAAAQLGRGCSVVLDGVARDVEVAGTRAIGATLGARVVVAVTSCRDRALHRSRLEGRERSIPGWHELGWDHVERFLEQWQPLADVDLSLDAADPFETNVTRLLTSLGGPRR